MLFNAQKYFAAGQRRVWQAKAAKLVVLKSRKLLKKGC